MSLAEIQEAIQRLEPEEREQLWVWFQDFDEPDELIAAIDEGIRAADQGRVFSLEQIKEQMGSWITK